MKDTDLNNEQLKNKLPDLKKELDLFNTSSFQEYETKLDRVTAKAMAALEGIVDDGSLAMDPEQLVKSVQVLTKAKTDIYETRRRLVETVVRGEVMMKALEPMKKKEGSSSNSVLDDYLSKTKKISGTATSVFTHIENETKEN